MQPISEQVTSVYNLITWESIWTKTIERLHLYNRQTKRLYASRMERTPSKREQNNLMNSGGLNRFMAAQPRTYSPFLYDSSLAAHMLTVFKTSIMNIKTTNHNWHMQLYRSYINQSFHANIIKQFNHSTKLQMASLVWTESDYSYILRGASTTGVRLLFHI